jgi:hypothetical protein
VVETHAASRQPIEARRFDLRVAKTAQVVVHIVDRDEQDVGFGRGGVWFRGLSDGKRSRARQR